MEDAKERRIKKSRHIHSGWEDRGQGAQTLLVLPSQFAPKLYLYSPCGGRKRERGKKLIGSTGNNPERAEVPPFPILPPVPVPHDSIRLFSLSLIPVLVRVPKRRLSSSLYPPESLTSAAAISIFFLVVLALFSLPFRTPPPAKSQPGPSRLPPKMRFVAFPPAVSATTLAVFRKQKQQQQQQPCLERAPARLSAARQRAPNASARAHLPLLQRPPRDQWTRTQKTVNSSVGSSDEWQLNGREGEEKAPARRSNS